MKFERSYIVCNVSCIEKISSARAAATFFVNSKAQAILYIPNPGMDSAVSIT